MFLSDLLCFQHYKEKDNNQKHIYCFMSIFDHDRLEYLDLVDVKLSINFSKKAKVLQTLLNSIYKVCNV